MSALHFFYCDYQDNQQQTTENIIGGLLKQALSIAKFPEDVIHSILDTKKERKKSELEDIIQCLSTTLRKFKKTYVCIDALDECNKEHRRKLIRHLKDIAASESLVIRFFFTGRPQIKEYINLHPATGVSLPLSVNLEASEEDIIAYICHKLEEDTKVLGRTEDFKKEIIDEIVATSQGMLVHEYSSTMYYLLMHNT